MKHNFRFGQVWASWAVLTLYFDFLVLFVAFLSSFKFGIKKDAKVIL